MTAPIRTYCVRVDGYTSALYSARSPGKAMARAWRDFREVYRKSFRDFLAIARVRRAPDPPGVGQRITVAGDPATRVIGVRGNWVAFMRDDSDTVLFAHPSDVEHPQPEDA